MRIITGAFAFFDNSAGIAIDTAPPPLLPKPPPQYSLINTIFDGSTPTHCASGSTVRTTLCVEPWRYSVPFCQYAIALRDSIGWWPVDCTTNVSSTTMAAFLKPASRSPNDHSSGALPIGSAPAGALAKSCSVHFSVWSFGRGGGPPAPGAAGAAGNQKVPSSRPVAPGGRRASARSKAHGRGPGARS